MRTLSAIFDGWSGYQTSIQHAVEQLSTEQLRWRPAPDVRSLGEVIRHLALGRITWLSRMHAPAMEGIRDHVPRWYTDQDGAHHVREESVGSDESGVLTYWLNLSWTPIQQVLEEWAAEDLFQTYIHQFRGTKYEVSNQWTLWRIMSHDLHHGGQIAMMLACQGVPAFELRSLGGHVVSPPVAPPER